MALTRRLTKCEACGSTVKIEFEPNSLGGMFADAGFAFVTKECASCAPINHDGTPKTK